jgi:putative transposase
VVSKAIVIATGVAADGNREVLGLAVGDSEDTTFWTAFLRDLRARGVSGVRLVISDAHQGLRTAIDKVMLGAAWQRSSVHDPRCRRLCSSASAWRDAPVGHLRRRERTLAT